MHRDALLTALLTRAGCDQPPAGVQWWQNLRDTGGLRLTAWAHEFLCDQHADSWSFDIDPTWITPRNMLRMDRLIPVPYSIIMQARPRRCSVMIWDSAQAMTIELMGDFDRFLLSLERAWARCQ